MTQSTSATYQSGPMRKTRFLTVGLLAWLVPGAGHYYLGRPIRAAILLIVMQGMFWTGIGIGGVFTVNPREEAWWWRAQMVTGVSGIYSHWRQQSWHRRIEATIAPEMPPPPADRESRMRWNFHYQSLLDRELAVQNLALVPPASDLARILTGVAGMLNLMVIFDAVMLSLMGRYGEPRPRPASSEKETTA